MKKKYAPRRPRKAYVLGTLVCFSRLLRTGYLESYEKGQLWLFSSHQTGACACANSSSSLWDSDADVPPYQSDQCSRVLCPGTTLLQ